MEPDLRQYFPDATILGIPYTAQTVGDVDADLFVLTLEPDNLYLMEVTLAGYASDNSEFFCATIQAAVQLIGGVATLMASSRPFLGRSNPSLDAQAFVDLTEGGFGVNGMAGKTINWSGTVKYIKRSAN